MSPFSEALRDLRLRHGMRQEELATHLGYEQTYISALEIGSRGPPDEEVLDRLAVVLRLDAGERTRLARAAQLSRRRYRLPQDAPSEIFEMFAELFENWDRMHPSQVGFVREIVRFPQRLAEPAHPTQSRLRRRRKEAMDD